MCYGLTLNSGNKCPHESVTGNCYKPKELSCPKDADYCEECETFFDVDNPCECGEKESEDDDE